MLRATTPTCSPSAPTRRTGLMRIWSLVRVRSAAMMASLGGWWVGPAGPSVTRDYTGMQGSVGGGFGRGGGTATATARVGVSLRCGPGRASRTVGHDTNVPNRAEPPPRGSTILPALPRSGGLGSAGANPSGDRGLSGSCSFVRNSVKQIGCEPALLRGHAQQDACIPTFMVLNQGQHHPQRRGEYLITSRQRLP